MTTETDERLTTLELRFMQQQHELEQLGEVLIAQQRELELLRRCVDELRNAHPPDLGRGEAAPPAHDPPPHY